MQKFNSTKIKLKNNKVVLIRQAEISDAENLLQCLKKYVSQSEYLPKLEEEIKLTEDQEREWINSLQMHDNSLLLIAEFENQIIGNIDLTGSRRKVMEHTGVIGLGMLNDWTNAGLGTALLTSVISWAMENPILETIWLQVYTENTLGLNLYKKVGFQENGVLKDFFKKDGRYYHNLTMSMKVK
jgi:RimJ/RimL family protein N-acetyltransferase